MPKLKWREVWATFVLSLQPQAQAQVDVRPSSPSELRIDFVKATAPAWEWCVHCAGRGDLIRDTGEGETTLEICSVCGGSGRLLD